MIQVSISPKPAPFIPLSFVVDSGEVQEKKPRVIAEPSKQRGRPRIVHTNSLKASLSAFDAPGFALATLPYLDPVVTGAVNLDMDGNTRPLSKKLMVRLLQSLDVISAEAVREYMHLTSRQCSERHAQKIALCLRVIENALAPIAKTMWPSGRPKYEVEPCGRKNCPVCALSEAEAQDVEPEAFDFEFVGQTEELSDTD
jgi:hypothetical protein